MISKGRPQDLLKELYEIRALHHDLFKIFSQGPVQDHAKAFDRISLGSPQVLVTRTCEKT
jgi:hypothetical protein